MADRSEQPTAPYLDAVVGYAFRGPGRFHVPGHKGGVGADPGLRFALGDRALAFDVCQDLEGIDVGPSPTPYERAELLAAEAYGVRRSWFLTNGATQGNHAMCLALAPLGRKVIAQRNSHASIVDGLVLSGGIPSFVAPEYDLELGMANGVTPESVGPRAGGRPRTRAPCSSSRRRTTAWSPTSPAAPRSATRPASPLVVDQAWGPHFGFHPDLPPSAATLGADAVLTSTHKIIGSLTQSAMLHVVDGERIDIGAVGRAMRLLRTTSPSSLLLASLDASRRQIAVHGEAILHETLAAVMRTRAKLAAVPGLALIGEDMVGRPGVVAWDPMRIAIDVRGTGCSGYEVVDALRQSYDVQPELATHATVVLVVGAGERPEALERVAGDIDETVKRISRPGEAEALVRPPAALGNEMAVAPREAFLGVAELVGVDDAVGRISCESIAGYPPGIPALLPGERITAETVAYLRELVASGARLHGASDPAFGTINVLAD